VSVVLSPPGRPTEVYDLHLLLYMIHVVGDDSEPVPESAFRQKARFSLECAPT
jgi:hypothetical protein